MKPLALITGASRGIGAAIAIELAKSHRLLLVSRNETELAEITSKINVLGGEAKYSALDLANDKKLIEWLESADVIPEVLINNAGVGAFKPSEQFGLDDYNAMFNLNTKAVFLLTRHFLPKGTKTIVSIISDGALRFFPNGSLYSASKAAQHAYLKSLRTEWQPKGVRVCNIYPGLTNSWFNGQNPEAGLHTNKMKTEEIARAVRYVLDAPTNVVIDEITLHPIQQQY
jgi:NADP-dependent 3-hydroxy acid dehydrogenase YdfG